jgi:hypothetical protein
MRNRETNVGYRHYANSGEDGSDQWKTRSRKQETINQITMDCVSNTRDMQMECEKCAAEDVDDEVVVAHGGLYLGPIWPDHLDASRRELAGRRIPLRERLH